MEVKDLINIPNDYDYIFFWGHTIYGYEEIKRQRLFCPEGKEFEDTIELANIILALADDLTTG